VKEKSRYKGVKTGELEFDLKNHMRVIRDEMARDQLIYDKIKATDVPYKWVIAGFIMFLFIMAGGSYIGQNDFKVSLDFILWANIIFFLLQTFCLLLITYYCFKQ